MKLLWFHQTASTAAASAEQTQWQVPVVWRPLFRKVLVLHTVNQLQSNYNIKLMHMSNVLKIMIQNVGKRIWKITLEIIIKDTFWLTKNIEYIKMHWHRSNKWRDITWSHRGGKYTVQVKKLARLHFFVTLTNQLADFQNCCTAAGFWIKGTVSDILALTSV